MRKQGAKRGGVKGGIEGRRGEQVPWQQLLRRGADGARRSGYGRRAWSPSTMPGRPEPVTHTVYTLFIYPAILLSSTSSPSVYLPLSVLTHECC